MKKILHLLYLLILLSTVLLRKTIVERRLPVLMLSDRDEDNQAISTDSSSSQEESRFEDINSSQDFVWDNHQEEPSFISNYSGQNSDPSFNRLSSTDHNLLEESFSHLLPADLFDSEEEPLIEEIMPPKTPVQNYADFVYYCSILKDDHTLAQGYGENLSDDTICQLKTQFKEINRIYLAIRKADPNFAVSFPELKGKRDES